MKNTIKKTLFYILSFILLFIVGIIISDIIIIAKAKYILHIADSLNFEKNMQELYPTLPDNINGFSLIRKVYDARQNLPEHLKACDNKITKIDLRNLDSVKDEMQKFRQSPEVTAVLSSFTSVPYSVKFSFNYASEPELLEEKLNIIKSMHNFYIYQLRFCSIEQEKLKSLHIFQKMLILHRALEKQNLTETEDLRRDLWLNAVDCLVHYGPTEKRYAEYYNSLKMLTDSLDFEYCSPITIQYNQLKNSIDFRNIKGKNIFEKHNIYITNLKKISNNFRNTLMTYPMPADFNRNPQLPKDIFTQKKIISQTHLKTLMNLKLYQLKHGSFPEAIEGFAPLPFIDMLVYKRISPSDFVLTAK